MFIKDKKISSISGPVSFGLLKPKKFIFEELKKEGVHLPIFMLFGDIHFSYEHQCEKCSCNLQDRSCCMPVYSNEFLRLIDSMATKEHPIDFGIEGFSLDTKTKYFKKDADFEAQFSFEKDTKGKGIIPKLRENLATCYQKDLRGSEVYEKYCPTKNIRWHYMDARFADENKYNLELLLSELKDLDKKIFKTDYKDKKELKKDIDEVKAKFDSDEMWKLILDLKIQLIENPEKGMERYFNIGEAFKYSLVLKQFNKLSKSFKDLPFWKKSLSDYLEYVTKKEKDEAYSSFKSLDNPQKAIDEARIKYYYLLLTYDIEGLFELVSDPDKYGNSTRSLAREGNYFNSSENTIFLDLYYILRTFKIPKGDKNPFLSILYAGDFHIRNIKYFLTNIIKYYEVVEEVNRKGDLDNEDPELRCSFIPNVNFNDLALEYGVNVNKPIPKPYVAPVSGTLGPVVQPKPYVAPYVAPSRGSRRAPAGRKTSARRAPAGRKTSARRASTRRAPARKTSARRAPARRSPARRRK